jgi:hypothetical protein
MEALANIWFWVNALVFSSMLFLIIYLVFRNIVWRKRLEDGSLEYLKLTLESQAKIKALVDEIEKRENKSIEQTDGFVKFLSQSREWAFEYIENVQKALAKFSEDIDPTVEYHKKYGQVLGPTVHTGQLDKIVLAYDELKKLMPENTNNNDPESIVQDKEK